MTQNALFEARALTIILANYLVCQNLSFILYPGQCCGILGLNGSGKTTLLRTLAGLSPVKSGSLWLRGVQRTTLGRQVWAQQLGMLLQENFDPFPATVLEETLIGRYPHLDWLGWETEMDYTLALHALTAVGLADFTHRNATTLSGGEYQRLRIARLIAQNPSIGLLDEPMNHLDPPYQIRITSLLIEKFCVEKAGSLIMVLHDINLAARFCSHCILLFGKGDFIVGSTDEILTKSNLQRLYQYPMVEVEAPWGKGWLPA